MRKVEVEEEAMICSYFYNSTYYGFCQKWEKLEICKEIRKIVVKVGSGLSKVSQKVIVLD